MQVITTSNAPQAIGAYVQAVSAHGNFLFISGQLPMESKEEEIISSNVKEQVSQSMQNMGEILKAAGLHYKDLIKTTIYLTDMSSFKDVNEAYSAFFSDGIYPARVVVEVAALPKGSLVEIDGIAQIP